MKRKQKAKGKRVRKVRKVRKKQCVPPPPPPQRVRGSPRFTPRFPYPYDHFIECNAIAKPEIPCSSHSYDTVRTREPVTHKTDFLF